MNTVLLAGLALSLAAPALKDPPAKTSTLEGEWALMERIIGGKPDRMVNQSPGTTFRIADGRWTFQDSGAPAGGWEIRLDTDKRPPEFTLLDQGGKGKQQSSHMAGIYKIEGDTLTLCYVFKGPPPTTFESPAGTDIRIMVLKRVKPDK
ncbi:MAG TPA: TIGR03067 domain-containing protein [Gemmataceae bacterium]|nr:TIGR03067 domain-containing protein [Gemmataceae bacterium]